MGQINRREHNSGSSLRRVEPVRLDSWKEIAAYLHRDARTVRRWEQERKLPVHRVPGGERSGVFAYVSELDRWLRAPSLTPNLDPDLDPDPDPSPDPSPDRSSGPSPDPSPGPGTVPLAPSRVAPLSILRSSASIEDESNEPLALEVDRKPEGDKSGISSAASILDSGLRRRGSDNLPQSLPYIADTLSSALPAISSEEDSLPLAAPEPGGLSPAASPRPSHPALWTGSRNAVHGILWMLGLAVVIGTGFGYRHYREVHPSVVAQYRPNAEAQDLYLRGRYFWNLRSEDGLNRAVDLFTQSIVTDPRYAAAYAGLADSYLLLRQYGHMSDAEAYPRALAAARQAISLDPSLPDAHRSLGFVQRFWNWDMPSAEHEYLRAIELDPGNSQSHHWYATALLSSGRIPEAIVQIDIARGLEPQSASVLADRGLILTFSDARLGAQALEQMTQAQPEFVSAHTYLSGAYLGLGNYAGFLEEAKAAAELKHETARVEVFSQARKVFDARGAAPMLRRLAHDLGNLSGSGEVSAYYAAQIYGLSGDSAQAMHFLQLAHDRRDPGFLQVERDSAFKSLGRSPEFLTLAAQTGRQSAETRQPIAHLALPGSR